MSHTNAFLISLIDSINIININFANWKMQKVLV